MGAIQVVKIDKSILNYFSYEMNLGNTTYDYRELKLREFKQELEKALNTGVGTKEIEWI